MIILYFTITLKINSNNKKKHSYLDRTIYCKTFWNSEDKSARAETMTNYFIFLTVSNVI